MARDIRRKVITLCGSTKFKEAFQFWNKHLTLIEESVVISVAFFGHQDSVPPTENEKVLLDKIHKDKILLADTIFVIDIGGYIGDSTKDEIGFARSKGIEIWYLSDYVVKLSPEQRPDGLNGSEIFKGEESLGWYLPQQIESFAKSSEEFIEKKMTWGEYKRSNKKTEE